MKIIYLFLLTLLAFTPKPEDNKLLTKKSSNNLCAAVVYSITNNNSGATVTSVKLTGCSASTNNVMSLRFGTFLLNNGPNCAYKAAFVKVTGKFNTINLLDTLGNILATEFYDPANTTGRYDFVTPGCANCTLEIN